MADDGLGAVTNARLVGGAGLAVIMLAAACAIAFGNPVVLLVTSYAVAFGAAIVLFGDDAFSRAFNLAIAVYAAAIVFVCTLSPLPNAEIQGLPLTDRLNYYYIYYIGNGLAGAEENIEPGYLLLVNLARLVIPFEMFLALVAVGVLAAMLGLVRSFGQGRIVGVLALSLLAYFSFWSGALNITRQFVAAGIGMLAVIVLLRTTTWSHWTRGALYLALVGLGFSVHSSVLTFVLFGFLYAVRRHRGVLLAAVWAGNIAFFALNFIGASPLAMVPGLSDRLARYDSSQISDASLAQFQSAGVTIGNRPDWALALALPMIVYALRLFIQRRYPQPDDDAGGLFLFALLYTACSVPFYVLSFLTFGDRIAFYAFLLLPAFLLALVTTTFGKEGRYAVLAVIGIGCVLQMAFGLYGYTPSLRLTGMP